MPRRVFRAAPAALLMALFLSLWGCDGEEASSDRTSPNHIVKAPKSQDKYRYGITDTIAVEFDEDIDTAALDLDFTDSAGIGWGFQGRRKALIHGTRKSLETRHFPVNTPFTLTMTGLRDPAGNGHPSIDLPFLPYRWADRDFLDTTFDWYDTLYAESTWIDGSPFTDTLLIEGALDYAQNFGRVDRYDFKVLRVAAPDTLSLFLTARKDMNVRLYVAGPFKPATFDSLLRDYKFETAPTSGTGTKVFVKDSTGTQGRVSRQFATDLFDHKAVFDDYDAPGLYVLRLGVSEGIEGFYRLGAQVKRRKP